MILKIQGQKSRYAAKSAIFPGTFQFCAVWNLIFHLSWVTLTMWPWAVITFPCANMERFGKGAKQKKALMSSCSSNQTLSLHHILLVISTPVILRCFFLFQCFSMSCDPLTPNQRWIVLLHWANKTCLVLLDVSASFLLYEYFFLSEKIKHFWPHRLLCHVTSWL